MAEISDLTKDPLTGKAWRYLTARVENRPPFRYFVRWGRLVSLAFSLGKQITVEEITALIQEDMLMKCRHHENDGTFMGVRRLVTLSPGKRIVNPNSLDAVPETLWPFIKRRYDGLPIVSGTVSVVLDTDKDAFIPVPRCGALLFLMKSRERNRTPIETIDRNTHLGSYIRDSRDGRWCTFYALDDAESVVYLSNKYRLHDSPIVART